MDKPEIKEESKIEKISEPKKNPANFKNDSGNLTLFTLEEEWEDELNQPIAVNENKKENESQAKQEFDYELPKSENKSNINSNFQANEIKIPSNEKAKNTVEEKQVVKEVEEAEAFEQPISAIVSQQIKDRRDRLKKFNFQFKNKLSEHEVNDAERIPAYQRNQVNLSEHKREKPGNYILDKDNNNDLKIRPNNFLHDNVD